MVSDTTPAQNGGKMAYTQMVSGMKNNLFPDVSQAERVNGSTKFRKAFIHLNNISNTALTSVKVFLDSLTPGDDYVVFYPGTAVDTEASMGTPSPYGLGTLAVSASAAATTVRVTPEQDAGYASMTPFRVGGLVRVSNQPSTGGAGTTDWVTLTAVDYQPTYIDLTFTGTPLVNAYTAGAGVLVSSVLEVPTVVGTAGSINVASTSGLFDGVSVGNLVAHNKGAVADTWTVTFLTATTYSITGAVTGLVAGTGSINSDFSPANPGVANPYFTIKTLCWGGSWLAGDTVSFTTSPASIPIWYKRVIPAGANSLANNFMSLAINGESV